MFASIGAAVATLVCLGLVGGGVLALAARFLSVQEDPRIAQVTACLPGANCGACGYAGCADYAKAVVQANAALTACVPGGQAAADAIAAALGRESQTAAAPRKAVVACQGSADRRGFKYQYEGIASCAAVNMLYSGPTDCRYGCLGYGDCTRACPFGAIQVVDGVARVQPDKCTGCGMCEKACPDHIIRVVPASQAPMVFCANHERGVVTRQHCKIGCIGCGKCLRVCPSGAITLNDNLAAIDMTLCSGCHACVAACPVQAIALPAHMRQTVQA